MSVNTNGGTSTSRPNTAGGRICIPTKLMQVIGFLCLVLFYGENVIKASQQIVPNRDGAVPSYGYNNPIKVNSNDMGMNMNMNMTATQQLKSRAYSLLKEASYKGVATPSMLDRTTSTSSSSSQSISPMEHYAVTKFQLSPGHAAGFTFLYTNALDPAQLKNANTTTTNHVGGGVDCRERERFICRMYKNKNNMNGHFPHFAQEAFPCFSALQKAMRITSDDAHKEQSRIRTRTRTRFILQIVVKGTWDKINFGSKWIKGLLKAFKKAGIEVSIIHDNQIHVKGCDWIAGQIKDTQTSGWAIREDRIDTGSSTGNNATVGRWPVGNAKYFSKQR